jgi:sugar phosphate isomerase/epimerase
MKIRFGINTGFAINRFPEPEDWTTIVADELKLDTIQFTADLLNPFLPQEFLERETEKIRALCEEKHIFVQTTFTSAFTRVNHVTHPNAELRRIWIDWFKRFFKLSHNLGAEGVGSHFGIMSTRDNMDPAIRAQRLQNGVQAWRELSEYAESIGLKYLLFEPMSVSREFAETIDATRQILDACSEGFPVPMRLCLDVDHGDLQSANPDDTDPHAWIRTFAGVSPCIHIKQSLRDKGGHYPFIAQYNSQGKIIPREILRTMQEAGINECTLLLEISHRERWPYDGAVVADLKESVEYWRPYIDEFNNVSQSTS